MAVATSILVGSAIAAGASAGAGIYAANKQAGAAENAAKTQSTAAEKSAKLQTDSANYAAQLQAQAAREALDYSRGQSQLSLDQYNQQQQRLQPYRNLGNFALGLPPDAAPAPLRLPGSPAPQAQQSGRTSQSSADPAAYALSLIQSGVDPQQAAAQTNQKFNLQTGSQAVYYDPSQHGGHATIGLPSAYLSDNGGGNWGITQRGGGTGSAGVAPQPRGLVTLGSIPSATPLMKTTPLTPALQPPQLRYRPLGSLGDY